MTFGTNTLRGFDVYFITILFYVDKTVAQVRLLETDEINNSKK